MKSSASAMSAGESGVGCGDDEGNDEEGSKADEGNKELDGGNVDGEGGGSSDKGTDRDSDSDSDNDIARRRVVVDPSSMDPVIFQMAVFTHVTRTISFALPTSSSTTAMTSPVRSPTMLLQLLVCLLALPIFVSAQVCPALRCLCPNLMNH